MNFFQASETRCQPLWYEHGNSRGLAKGSSVVCLMSGLLHSNYVAAYTQVVARTCHSLQCSHSMHASTHKDQNQRDLEIGIVPGKFHPDTACFPLLRSSTFAALQWIMWKSLKFSSVFNPMTQEVGINLWSHWLHYKDVVILPGRKLSCPRTKQTTTFSQVFSLPALPLSYLCQHQCPNWANHNLHNGTKIAHLFPHPQLEGLHGMDGEKNLFLPVTTAFAKMELEQKCESLDSPVSMPYVWGWVGWESTVQCLALSKIHSHLNCTSAYWCFWRIPDCISTIALIHF